MNRYILVFSMISLFSVGHVYAEDFSATEGDLSMEDLGLSEVDFSDVDTDSQNFETTPKTGGSIYVEKPHVPTSSNSGPLLKAPNNTFPLSRSGMMVSPTPIANSPQPLTVGSKDKTTKESGSLTGIFDEGKQAEQSSQMPSGKEGETWLDRLRTTAEAEIKSSDGKKEPSNDVVEKEDITGLSSLVEKTKETAGRRSNAAVFDISGAMLRMNPTQIDEVLVRRGYRKTNEKFEIPNFIKWRKEDECRASGVVGYERLASCVVKASKAENYQYLEVASYSKFDTQESISVNFTSNFTGNKAFKMIYKSMASNITGNSQKSIYMRNIKIYDFWKQISQKYGAPDNKDDVIWGLGGNKPYLQAKTGKLLLEDPMLRELDYTRMSREDQKFINTGVYNF